MNPTHNEPVERAWTIYVCPECGTKAMFPFSGQHLKPPNYSPRLYCNTRPEVVHVREANPS